MKIELLCTGDEILSGKTVNTNYSYMARKLLDHGFNVTWGTTVGDDRQDLLDAFHRAGSRADAVIVNGGLGPTVDDLSQEVAAQAAGVELELDKSWYGRIEAWYQSRGRKMPENNTKQAMLPQGSEFIDNPIGTACGFAMDIGGARFFFTPGVPRELFRMMEEQVIPRLQKMRGTDQVTLVKRFHTFGIGESRADRMLDGIEDIDVGRPVKLGFQSHFPQLETKLTVHGKSGEDLTGLIAPAEQAVRDRLGNFILSEDDESLEDVIVSSLVKNQLSLVVAEMHTSGTISARLAGSSGYQEALVKSIVAPSLAGFGSKLELSEASASKVAQDLCDEHGANTALVVLSAVQDRTDETEPYADLVIAVQSPDRSEVRVSRLPGSVNWTRSGAAELGLDCLRRLLMGLPVSERIDFEQH